MASCRETGRGALLNWSSRLPDDQIGQGTELNWTELIIYPFDIYSWFPFILQPFSSSVCPFDMLSSHLSICHPLLLTHSTSFSYYPSTMNFFIFLFSQSCNPSIHSTSCLHTLTFLIFAYSNPINILTYIIAHPLHSLSYCHSIRHPFFLPIHSTQSYYAHNRFFVLSKLRIHSREKFFLMIHPFDILSNYPPIEKLSYHPSTPVPWWTQRVKCGPTNFSWVKSPPVSSVWSGHKITSPVSFLRSPSSSPSSQSQALKVIFQPQRKTSRLCDALMRGAEAAGGGMRNPSQSPNQIPTTIISLVARLCPSLKEH